MEEMNGVVQGNLIGKDDNS